MVGPTLSKTASATLTSRLLELRRLGFREAELTQGRVMRALTHGALREGGHPDAGAGRPGGRMSAPRKSLCDLVLLARELKQE